MQTGFTENVEHDYLKHFVRTGLSGLWAEEAGAINIVCIQGATPEAEGANPVHLVGNANALDKYNDSIIFCRRHPKTSKGEIYAAPGTVDPGLIATQVKPHPLGAAHLCFGQHSFERYNRTKDNRLVLRGVKNVTRFWRDSDKDAGQDIDEPVLTRAIGLWFHAMGKGESIGEWSYGCVGPKGGYAGKAWLTLLKWLKHHPDGKPVTLTLWSFADYRAFSRAVRHSYGPILFWPVLRKGIRDLTEYGPVHRLQESLREMWIDPGKIDGDWMNGTQAAFLKFQREQGLTVDGVCGEKSWLKLKTLIRGG